MGGYYHTEYMEYMLKKKGRRRDFLRWEGTHSHFNYASPPFFFFFFSFHFCWVFVGLSHTRCYEYRHTSSAE